MFHQAWATAPTAVWFVKKLLVEVMKMYKYMTCVNPELNKPACQKTDK